jgi:hypothetical protein
MREGFYHGVPLDLLVGGLCCWQCSLAQMLRESRSERRGFDSGLGESDRKVPVASNAVLPVLRLER